jgi:3-oxoacyl-[acyl-carrier protein] reductase
MPELLVGRRALVTGAGRGMGPVIAKRLAAEGAAVALAYRSSQAGAAEVVKAITGQGGVAVAIQADLLEQAQADALIDRTVDALGGLDIVVNNAAGFGPAKLLQDSDWEDIAQEWEAVVKPVLTVTRAALPHLLQQRRGRIVNIAATLLQRPAVTYGAHAMAKAAVLAYTRTLAREVGPDGITVNAVSPGMTLTEYSQSLPRAEQAAVRDRTPLRRLAEPEDVANAILFFCSPLADFVTGANIAPDGGLAVL